MCIRDRHYISKECIIFHVKWIIVCWACSCDQFKFKILSYICLLYTSDAADDLLCVDLGGRRIIKKNNNNKNI